MKISIVTATFNSAATVRDTIESVLNQTYTDWELIIKDGGSKDNTLNICRSYADERINIVACADKGLYDAMNQGIAAATGEVIGILNSDDFYYDNQVLERIATVLADDTIGCVYGNLQFVDALDTSKVVRVWKGSQYQIGGFRKGWHPAHPTFYAKKKYFDEFGSFDTSFDVSADFELMLRFIEKHQVPSRFIPHYFVKMRMGGESTGSLKNIIKGNKNILRAFKQNSIPCPPFYLVRRLAPKAFSVVKTKLGV